MSRQSRSKAQARLKAKRSRSGRRAAAPVFSDELRAEAEAADARIRELVARQRELEVPIRAELEPVRAAAAALEKQLEVLGQAEVLSLEGGQPVVQAIFRHLVGAAWVAHELSSFDAGPEERAIVDDLVRRLDEAQAARASRVADAEEIGQVRPPG